MGAWSPKAEQVAMAAYLKDTPGVSGFLADLKSRIQDSLQTLYKGFMELKSAGFTVDAIEPMGAIYLTVKIDYTGKTTPDGDLIKNSADVNFYMIKEAGCALVPFSAFGKDESLNWFRASVGASTTEEIADMVPRIKAALKRLK